jgi:hypothetical protein
LIKAHRTHGVCHAQQPPLKLADRKSTLAPPDWRTAKLQWDLSDRQIFGSKVRLEIKIVADLAVDLQAIALAVSNDDLAGGRVEVNCRREAQAPQRL